VGDLGSSQEVVDDFHILPPEMTTPAVLCVGTIFNWKGKKNKYRYGTNKGISNFS
jgi:hypothetical protein